jgi:hypothetical protein
MRDVVPAVDSVQPWIDTQRAEYRANASIQGGEAMAKAENKSVGKPDEVRKFEKGQIDLVNIGGGVVGKATFQPGWRWSEHVKPIAKTEWCEAPHFM